MELTPEELLLVALVRLTIRDAQQTKNERLRQDALRWLWWVAPSVAERAGVPQLWAVCPTNLGELSQGKKALYSL